MCIHIHSTCSSLFQELLVSESGCAFTMNRTEFEVLSSTFLRQLREACAQVRAEEVMPASIPQNL